MAEYIAREAVVDLITRRYECPEICVAEINAIPIADVKPVIHGHIVWKRRHRGGFTQKKCIKNGGYGCDHNAVIDDRSVGEEPYCSECGKILGDCMNFCGNCGARMDGESSDTNGRN